MKKRNVCIIGGGASGMIAALFAAKEGAAVTILEHNDKVGKKFWQQEMAAVISQICIRILPAITAVSRTGHGKFYSSLMCSKPSVFSQVWDFIPEIRTVEFIPLVCRPKVCGMCWNWKPDRKR